MDIQISPFVELFENLRASIPFAEVLKLFAGLPFNRSDFPVYFSPQTSVSEWCNWN